MSETLKLHIGGKEKSPGWKILNIAPNPDVDFVGSCTDLEQFYDNSVTEIYASHVLEHLGFRHELPKALSEFYRILTPGGIARISVPDMDILCQIVIHPQLKVEERIFIMSHLFGGQTDQYDFHKVGLNFELLSHFLVNAGFKGIARVDDFHLFNDCSSLRRFGHPISVNVEARK